MTIASAMAHGHGGGRRRRRRGKRGVINEINMTPFIDVMLVLLIIFMVTAPLMTAGMAANRPMAVANSASAMPGATTARLVLLEAAIDVNEFMMPITVPNRPI